MNKKEIIELLENGMSLKDIKNVNQEIQLIAIEYDCKNFNKIENPSEEFMLKSIEIDPYVIEFIKNPTYEMQLKAIKKCCDCIRYIKNPTYELQLEAVKSVGYAIKYINDQTYELQLEAIKEGLFLEYIKNPSDEIRLMSFVNQKKYKFKFFKNHKNLIDIAIMKGKKVIDVLYDIEEELLSIIK